ncbi:DNA internalization-related competence protein ComEC/Rec2 [Terrilactibacillus sp. BCM23-1]|uniref:DNA internalization-related competence protein ComEC/Rec2 n=1 Tax=Terrilactibacillus tamarindi TaxID=2599694 RepID=A0A6N8CTT7_9BACI|nr:DNA internalization-related competence protein ComEC/Rec2 [Terrilactibacillus tamarindi]MTT32493.1 DNA internalization-related competence protein ComEC/Rec2 [Terrilactibacillus tamarindi]
MMYGKCHHLVFASCLVMWMFYGTNLWIPLIILIVYLGYIYMRSTYSLFIGCLVVSVVFGMNILWVTQQETKLSPKKTVFHGKIITIPDFDGDIVSFQFKTDEGELVVARYTQSSISEKRSLQKNLHVGNSYQIIGQLEKPNFPTNFHSFNYRQYLDHKHIYWILTAEKPPHSLPSSITFIEQIMQWREKQIYRIQHMFPEPIDGLMSALIFGDQSHMPVELQKAYQTLGIVHILAVSGLHVVLLLAMVNFICLRLGMIREHVLVLLLLFIPMYVILTGAEASVIRAGLTGMFVLGYTLIKKIHLTSVDLISIVFLVMIFYDPEVLFQMGFQLSFLATSAILLSAHTIYKKGFSYLEQLLWLSVICELATFSILIPSFYQFSFISFVMNMIFVPLMTNVILPLSMTTYIVSYIYSPLSLVLSQFMSSLLIYPHRVLLYFYHHPHFIMTYGSLTPVKLFGMILLIYGCLCLWEYHLKRVEYLLIIPFVFMYMIVVLSGTWFSQGHVVFLDVGQGDSILIKLPHQKGTILIDTGGIVPYKTEAWKKRKDPFKVGRDVVLHELRGSGIRQIDMLILTHSDYDHIGGVKDLIGQIPIRKLIISSWFNPSPADMNMLKQAVSQGTKIQKVQKGDTINFSTYAFHVLSPTTNQDSNNNSIVLHTRLGGLNWLFTGDLEEEGENQLIKNYPRLSIDVLKVGHHGSQSSTSEQFLNVIKPNYAMISVGKNNRYGHPNQEVLQRLSSSHIKIMRTDQLGAIRWTFTNDQITRVDFAVMQ